MSAESEFHATGPVVRLIARRDRVRLLAWVIGVAFLVITTAASTKGIYKTQRSLDEAAALAVDNPAALAFNGPAQALDTMGGQIAFQLGAFTLLLIGLMSILMTGRLTRGEEESGRLELVRSMPVGRRAPIAAALLVVVALNVVVAIVVTVSLVAEDLPVGGSVALGVSYLTFGLAFVGITAVAAQISENPRVTAGTAGAVLGIAFVLRAVGDVGDGKLSWLSPMGWAQKVRPFAGEQWWPALMLVVMAVGLIWVAARLSERRDFGAGMIAPRAGPARAAPSLASPFGLAVRLHRAATFWWTLSVGLLGLTYGSLAEAIDDFVSDNEALTDMIAGYGGASLTDSYLSTSLLIVALMASGPAIQIAVRLRSEETDWRAETILATPVSRPRWVWSHFGVALAAGALAVLVGGLTLGLGYAITGGGAEQVTRLLAASVVYVPAVWVLTAVVLALFGAVPRWTALAWIGLGVCFVIAFFGPLLELPQWLMDLSPFQHAPAMPAAGFRAFPIAATAALAAALAAFGMSTFRRRNLITS